MELTAALIALAGVIVVQLVTLWVTNKSLDQQNALAKAERDQRKDEFARSLEEARRIEWKNYLIELMRTLIEARSEYEGFLGTDKTDAEEHAAIVGNAIAVCLATNDTELARIATDELTPYFADKNTEDWATRNRNAMQNAVLRLAEIIKSS